MRHLVIATLVLLGLVNEAGAVRVLREVERPFELNISQITLPPDGGGTVTLRGCDACRLGSFRLQGSTVFVVDGRQVPYADFTRTVDGLRASAAADATVVSLFIDRDTERVTRIAIHRPRR